MKQITFAQFGMGPIGIESIRLAATKGWLRCIGAVDLDPAKIGKSVGQLSGDDKLAGARVYQSFEELCEVTKPDIMLHTAGSKAQQSMEQFLPIVERGISVASTCEELLFPRLRAAAMTERFDKMCRESGARVVGTGVNPGFVMDVLPIFMTGVSRSVRSIYVERVVNATTRRGPLQKKIGSGMEADAFRKLFAEGKAGHAGLKESAALIAHAMAWTLDELTETCEPIVTDCSIRTQHVEVAAGQTCGLHQRCVGTVRGAVKVELDLKMYLEATDPHDALRIDGEPPLEVLVKGGVAGDQATVAALINVIPRLLKAEPGMRLMTDLAVPAWIPANE